MGRSAPGSRVTNADGGDLVGVPGTVGPAAVPSLAVEPPDQLQHV